MAALDDILVTPIAPKPIRLPGNQDVGVRGYDVSKIDTPKSYPGNPTARPTNLLRAGEKYPEVRRDVKVTDISEGNAGNEEQTEEKKRLSYVEMFEALNPQKPETAEERAKREKREKREAVLAAVGDGISALSNLFFTTQYAPNAYDPSKGMSAKARERWDKLRLEREANRRAYSDGYLRALAMDEAGDREERNWRHTLERERIADERYEIKAAQDNELFGINKNYYKSRADKEAENAARAKVDAEMEADRIMSIINKNNRSGIKLSGGRKGGKYVLQTPDGPKTYSTAVEYNAAVYYYAEKYGIGTLYERRTGNKLSETPFKTAEVAAAVQSLPEGAKPKSGTDGFDQYKKGANDDFSQYKRNK